MPLENEQRIVAIIGKFNHATYSVNYKIVFKYSYFPMSRNFWITREDYSPSENSSKPLVLRSTVLALIILSYIVSRLPRWSILS